MSFGISALNFTFNKHITSHHPASNGNTEHTKRKELEILRHLARHLQEIWEDWLSHVAASINSSLNYFTGKTPHYILYGFEKCLPYDVLVPSPVPFYFPDDYSKLQLHCFQTIHNSVWEKLKASREEMLCKQHSQATPVHLDVGDSAMKRAPDRSCKLTPKFLGPYLLTAKLHSNKFKILDPNTTTSEVVHVNHLKKVSASFTPAAVPSPPSPTDLLSLPDAHTSHSYKLRSAERHSSVSSSPFLFSLARSEAKLAPPCCIFLVFFFWGVAPIGYISFS